MLDMSTESDRSRSDRVHPSVRRIADALGVRIVMLEENEYPEGICWPGPDLGTYCNPEIGTVWFKDWFEIPWVSVRAQLHEVMHVVTHPPGMNIEMVPENFLLMQVEREYARATLPTRLFRDACSWQRETECHDLGILDDGDGWWRQPRWTAGYDVARLVGLLDEHRRPTWRPAVWPSNLGFDIHDSWFRFMNSVDDW